MSTRQKRTSDTTGDTTGPSPAPAPDRERPGEARPRTGEHAPAADHPPSHPPNHPDAPDHPTTPYDHIWYERRPLH